VSGDGEDGCGNVVPMETKKRFPQGLGNLSHNTREIPTFPQPIILFLRNETTKTEDH
jgi:hypothetical protein